MIYPHQNKIKLMNDQDVYKITVSAERYYEAIDQALDENEIEDIYSNTQEGDSDFNRDDKPIQSSISNLTRYFDKKVLKIAVNEQNKRSKISMAAHF